MLHFALPTSTIPPLYYTFCSHHNTWCYTYNTFFYYKQNTHFTYTDRIRCTIDNITVTKNKYIMYEYYFKEGREYFTSFCGNDEEAEIAAEMWNAEVITKEQYLNRFK